MSKTIKRFLFLDLIIIALLAVGTIATDLYSGDKTDSDKKSMCQMGCLPGKMEKATVTGVNYCVACELKTDANAAANCKAYGHQHALKITHMVDACGDINKEYVGKTLFYLANEKSKGLIAGEGSGGTVIIEGKVYLEKPMIEVVNWKTEMDDKHEKQAG